MKDESAFPMVDSGSGAHQGMSKRFYAACKAMQGLINLGMYCITDATYPQHTIIDRKRSVAEAFKIADEMLKQEDQ